jgi:phosphatidylserine/phosphatidylglycerophosphate/cardiolipin synthase-like enzyme
MRCQHQKVWLIDAGTPDEVAFVGGINIGAGSMAGRDHDEPARHGRYANIHDVHCMVRGPSVTDVHDNFVMRWNGASERDREHGTWPSAGTEDLDLPTGRTAPAGSTTAQIQRSVLPGLYPSLPDGENSIRAQYLAAIGGAEEYIYIEDQILLSRVVLVALGEALERGVVVVALVPGDPMPELARYRAFPGIAAGYDALAALGGFAGFCLAAPAARRSWGYEEIYVHSKTMVVDDRWATIGSANLIFTSFQGDTEMNVSFWDSEVARAFRVRQVDEQGGFESAAMGGREAVGRLAEAARSNAARRAEGDDLVGFACRIDPVRWAT